MDSYDGNKPEGKICLFDSRNNSVEQIAKFSDWINKYQVAATSDKVNNYDFAVELIHIIQIVAIHYQYSPGLFEIFDLKTRQISRGLIKENPRIIDSKNFTGSNPPEWCEDASVAYFKDKLYYLGGEERKTREYTNRVDVRKSNKSL